MSNLLPPKVNVDTEEKWRGVLAEVEKKEIPITVMERVTVHLIDGTDVDIGVREMLDDGGDPHEIEKHLNRTLTRLDQYIKDVDFHINVDFVVGTVQAQTDKMLKDI